MCYFSSSVQKVDHWVIHLSSEKPQGLPLRIAEKHSGHEIPHMQSCSVLRQPDSRPETASEKLDRPSRGSRGESFSHQKKHPLNGPNDVEISY